MRGFGRFSRHGGQHRFVPPIFDLARSEALHRDWATGHLSSSDLAEMNAPAHPLSTIHRVRVLFRLSSLQVQLMLQVDGSPAGLRPLSAPMRSECERLWIESVRARQAQPTYLCHPSPPPPTCRECSRGSRLEARVHGKARRSVAPLKGVVHLSALGCTCDIPPCCHNCCV